MTEQNDTPHLTSEHKGRNEAIEDITVLVASLETVMKTGGTEAVASYVTDALGETGKEMPKPERRALFEVLSRAQEVKLDTEGKATAKTMLEELEGSMDRTGRSLVELARPTKGKLEGLNRGFDDEVVRPARRGDTRMATRNVDSVAASSRNVILAVETYTTDFKRWAQDGENATETFLHHTVAAKKHKAAMEEAKRTLADDYEGEPKDLSAAIDEDVVQEVIAKIDEAFRQQDTKTALEAKLTDPQKSDSKEDKTVLADLQEFASSLYGDLKAKRSSVAGNSEDALGGLQRTVRKLNQDLPYIRQAEELIEVIMKSGRQIGGFVEDLSRLVTASAKLVEDVGQVISRLK